MTEVQQEIAGTVDKSDLSPAAKDELEKIQGSTATVSDLHLRANLVGKRQTMATRNVFIDRLRDGAIMGLHKIGRQPWMFNSPYGTSRGTDLIVTRQLSQSTFVKKCLDVRINEVISQRYRIVPRQSGDVSKETADVIELQEAFLRQTNPHDSNSTARKLFAQIVGDGLVVGSGVGIKRFDERLYKSFAPEGNSDRVSSVQYVPNDAPRGFLRELVGADGAAFTVQLGIDATDILGYWQYNIQRGYSSGANTELSYRTDAFSNNLNQTTRIHPSLYPATVPIFYSRREIIFHVFESDIVTYSPYGLAPVMTLLEIVGSLIASTINTQHFSEEGAIPKGFIVIKGINRIEYEKLVDQVKERKKWDTPVMHIPQVEGEIKWIPLQLSAEDIKFLEGIDVYRRIVMSALHVTPAELGLTDQANKASATQQTGVQRRQALYPTLASLENMMNTQVLPELDPRGLTKFEFVIEKDIEIKEKEAEIRAQKIKSGELTINEAREEDDLPRRPFGDLPLDVPTFTAEVVTNYPELYGLKQDRDPLDIVDTSKWDRDRAMYESIGILRNMQVQLTRGDLDSPGAVQMLTLLNTLHDRNQFGTLLPGGSVTDKLKQDEFARIGEEDKPIEVHMQELMERMKAEGDDDAAEVMKSFAADYQSKQIIDEALSEAFKTIFEGLVSPTLKAVGTGFKKIGTGIVRGLRGVLGRATPGDDELQAQTLRDAVKAVDRAAVAREPAGALARGVIEAYDVGSRLTDNAVIEPTRPVAFSERTYRAATQFLEEHAKTVTEGSLADLVKQVKRELTEGIISNQTADVILSTVTNLIEEELTKKSELLVTTEIQRGMTLGKLQRLKSLGIRKWKYYALIDERTCKTCGRLHNKIFSVDNRRDLPPSHPRCRCMAISEGEDLGQRDDERETGRARTR